MTEGGISRRQLLSSMTAAAGASILAGCGAGQGQSGSVQSDPDSPPEIDFKFGQSKGIYDKMSSGNLEWREFTLEITHNGGDPADPSLLDIEVTQNAGTDEFETLRKDLTTSEVYSWHEIVDELQSFENIKGAFDEGDYVIIFAKDWNRSNAAEGQPRGGDLIHILWDHPERDEPAEIGKYEVQACLGGETPTENGKCPGSQY